MDWRHASEKELRFWLDAPFDGICFDIECNRYWMEEWGEKPKYMHECFQIARDAVRAAPTLIPFYAHSYVPDEPTAEGNPVLWVWQTSIRHDGYDLAEFFRNTFNNENYLESPTVLPEPPSPPWMAQGPRPVRFWDEVRERGELCWVLHQDLPQEP